MFNTSIKTICILGLSSFAILNTQVQAQDFYKWVDASGSTHYTTTPPPKMHGVSGKGKIKTYTPRIDNTISSSANRVPPPSSSEQSAPSTSVQPQQPSQNSTLENKPIQLPPNIQPAPAPLPAKSSTAGTDDQNFTEIKK